MKNNANIKYLKSILYYLLDDIKISSTNWCNNKKIQISFCQYTYLLTLVIFQLCELINQQHIHFFQTVHGEVTM